jgi:hypothetical protein
MGIFDLVKKLQPTLELPDLEEVGDFGFSAPSFEDAKNSVGQKVSGSVSDFKTKVSSSLSNTDLDGDGSLGVKEIVKALIPILKPILISIATSEENINKITKSATSLLDRKGRVEIQGTTVNFYPVVDGPWLEIKAQFDRRIQSTTKTIEKINDGIEKLNKILGFANKILTGLQILLKFREGQIEVQFISTTTELASPSPSKPTTGLSLADILKKYEKNIKLQQTISDINEVIGVIKALITTANSLLSNLKFLLSQAQLNIINNPADYKNTKEELITSIKSTEVPLTLEETIIGSNGIKYTIKIVALDNGFNKAVAYEALSGLLITQTAPSIIKTPYELIQELKRILS